MANLVESKQASGTPEPVVQGRVSSRGQVNDCQSSISGGLTQSLLSYVNDDNEEL